MDARRELPRAARTTAAFLAALTVVAGTWAARAEATVPAGFAVKTDSSKASPVVALASGRGAIHVSISGSADSIGGSPSGAAQEKAAATTNGWHGSSSPPRS